MGGNESISEDDLASFHTLSIEDVENLDLRQRIGAAINLMDNINRATVAEVLVAMALDGKVTDAWGDWDVTLEEGTRIEVKSTGSIQAWPQDAPSPAQWSIGKTQGWVLTDGRYVQVETEERRSDFYILAAHAGLRPDDVTQWRFYVVPTDLINERLGDQKTITEASLIDRFEIAALTYPELCNINLSHT